MVHFISDTHIFKYNTGSISTKISKELNKAIFETEEPILTCSRNIGLLLKFNGSELVELSSNEWKRASVSHVVILYQQIKNIRTNTSILSNLMSRHGKEFNTIMTMDWIGNVGYIYFLEMLDNGIIVAKLFDKVVIPTDVSHLSGFKNTLNALFSFKTFIVDLCFKLKEKSQEIEFNNKLFSIIHRNTVGQGPPSPFIFYTPKNQELKNENLSLLLKTINYIIIIITLTLCIYHPIQIKKVSDFDPC
ncbi:unnamed protein product [Cunninghamella echinulata]